VTHRLYTDLAPWWAALANRDSHPAEAAHLQSILDEAQGRRVNSLLELGCGGGGIAAHFDSSREVVLCDLAEEMLAICRTQNPQRECVQGDMRSLRLDRKFDAVLLHDAVMYLTSVDDLQASFHTAAAHLNSGGVFAVVPDVLKEGFEERAVSGGTIGCPGIQLLEWHWDPDPSDDTCRLDINVLLRNEAGTMEAIHETHTLGLFSAETFVRCLMNAGLEPISGLIWDETLLPEVFIARKR
jgi:SAM-dependent methyltransferase